MTQFNGPYPWDTPKEVSKNTIFVDRKLKNYDGAEWERYPKGFATLKEANAYIDYFKEWYDTRIVEVK